MDTREYNLRRQELEHAQLRLQYDRERLAFERERDARVAEQWAFTRAYYLDTRDPDALPEGLTTPRV